MTRFYNLKESFVLQYSPRSKMSESVKANGDAKSPKKGKGTIEKIYQKKSQLEHILLRPDTYIGSVERNVELQWIYDNEAEKMVQKELSYVPGKISNFIFNFWRCVHVLCLEQPLRTGE